jgi:hypothetical protein
LFLERFLRRAVFRSDLTRRLTTGGVVVGLLLVAVLDQTPRRTIDTSAVRREVASDRAFFAEVAARVPRDGMVFELPNVGFPEGSGQNGTGAYDPGKGYLYQPQLSWSFGAMSGRSDGGIARLAHTDPGALAENLARAGYHGLVIDSRALGHETASLETAIIPTVGEPFTSADGRYLFHRLPPQAVGHVPVAQPSSYSGAINAVTSSSCPDSRS